MCCPKHTAELMLSSQFWAITSKHISLNAATQRLAWTANMIHLKSSLLTSAHSRWCRSKHQLHANDSETIPLPWSVKHATVAKKACYCGKEIWFGRQLALASNHRCTQVSSFCEFHGLGMSYILSSYCPEYGWSIISASIITLSSIMESFPNIQNRVANKNHGKFRYLLCIPVAYILDLCYCKQGHPYYLFNFLSQLQNNSLWPTNVA